MRRSKKSNPGFFLQTELDPMNGKNLQNFREGLRQEQIPEQNVPKGCKINYAGLKNNYKSN
jgi:hypothetical protein